MTKFQQGVQDVLNCLLVLALVGFGIQEKLSHLVSGVAFNWIELILGAALLLVYFADVIFFGKTPTIPSQPNLPNQPSTQV